MVKTYGATDLELLCNADSEEREKKAADGQVVDDGGVFIGRPDDGITYVLDAEHGGLFLRVKRGYIQELRGLPVEERLALLCGYSESTLKRGPRGFLVSPAPVLPFPFTAHQLWDFNRASGGAVIERFPFFPGTEDDGGPAAHVNDEWLAEQPPNIQELATTLLQEKPPREDTARPTDEPANARAMRLPSYRKRAALIRELRPEWPAIEADLREASRNGLSAARVSHMRGMWNMDQVRAWGTAQGKLRASKTQPGASWMGPVTRHEIE